ncbi:hypothetical protein H8958_016480, partial [Nasalis larvatus]
ESEAVGDVNLENISVEGKARRASGGNWRLRITRETIERGKRRKTILKKRKSPRRLPIIKVPPRYILPRRSPAAVSGSWPRSRTGDVVLKSDQGGTTEELGFPTGFRGACADGCPGECILLDLTAGHWPPLHTPHAAFLPSLPLQNSIRHNLSLHSKFIKVHNEATGKSSWWMLNPEGGKSGKAPRRRAASMDSSSKLLRGRSKAPKKKPPVLPAPPEGATPTSPVGHFAKWSGSPCSRNREEADMWTTFRPRSSSNASTVSTRLSPLRPESEVLAEEIPASVSSYAGGVPPTLNEGLELLDGLNLTSSHSLLSRSGLSGFSLQHPGVTGPLHTYNSSLFSPAEGPLSAGEGCFSSSQALEALLTSDTPPPPADVLMTQVDPILSQAPTLLLLGGLPSSSKLATGVGLCPKPLEAPGPSSLVPTLSMIAPPPVMASAPIPKALGTPVLTPPTEAASQDRMPQDLDLDMYMENLECDMDNIISDLMDGGEGLDFNFEP